jgi:hypothetical protein
MARPATVNATSPIENENSLLEQHGFFDLPEVFAMSGEDGIIIQERSACYQCRADGFYGRGVHGTLYLEGDVIVSDIIPNEHMAPLNRAAGLNYARWVESLPRNRVQIDVGDMSEAAMMLAKDPQAMLLPSHQHQSAVIKLAEELKLRREGKDARILPGMGHNFAPQSGSAAQAPILGAKMSSMNQRGPGDTRSSAAIPGGTAGARRGTPALGGSPQR